MPVYTYRCANCSTELDRYQSFNDSALTHCPACHEEQMQRVYKPIRVVFKGSGFYATDHRSSSGVGKNGQASKTEGDSKSAESEGKSTESDGASRNGKSAEGEKSESKTPAPAPAPETVS